MHRCRFGFLVVPFPDRKEGAALRPEGVLTSTEILLPDRFSAVPAACHISTLTD